MRHTASFFVYLSHEEKHSGNNAGIQKGILSLPARGTYAWQRIGYRIYYYPVCCNSGFTVPCRIPVGVSLIRHTSLSLYCTGVIPVCFLKKRPKKEGLGKFNSSDICRIVLFVVFSKYLADDIMASLIQVKAVRPVLSFTIVDRYLGVRHILSA